LVRREPTPAPAGFSPSPGDRGGETPGGGGPPMSTEPFRLETAPAELVSALRFRALLGVSPGGFRGLRDSGRLPEPIRVGARVFWTADVVAFHVAQRRHRLG